MKILYHNVHLKNNQLKYSQKIDVIDDKMLFLAQDSSQGQDEETRQLSDVEAVEAGLGDSIQTQAVRGKSLGDKMREKSWFGKKCVKIFRVFSNTFAMTFLAEWGDR